MSAKTIKHFSARAGKLRKIAAKIDDEEARQILLNAARNYGEMASAVINHRVEQARRLAADRTELLAATTSFTERQKKLVDPEAPKSICEAVL